MVLFQPCFDYSEDDANQEVELVADSRNEIILYHNHSSPIIDEKTSQNGNLCKRNGDKVCDSCRCQKLKMGNFVSFRLKIKEQCSIRTIWNYTRLNLSYLVLNLYP